MTETVQKAKPILSTVDLWALIFSNFEKSPPRAG